MTSHPTLKYAPTVHEAVPLTIYDLRSTFTIHDLRLRLSIALELQRYNTPREEIKTIGQTVGLGSVLVGSGGVPRAPVIPRSAPAPIRSARSQDPDVDLAPALKNIKVLLDVLDRLVRPPPGASPTSLPEQGSSSIPPQIDLRTRPLPSLSIQDGLQAQARDRIRTQVPSDTPGAYTNNDWIATNKTLEPGDADTRRPGLPNHYNPGPAPYSPDNPGPEVAGLQPHSTMSVQLKDVVSYRAYRLINICANVRDSEN